MISPTDIPEEEFSVELIIYIYIFLFDVEAWLLSALNPGGYKTWPDQCVVFLGKTLLSCGASLHPGV